MLAYIPPQLIAVLSIAAIAAIAVGTYALYERRQARANSRPERRP
jgi:hypothetical protein